jgi:hypothetical protein
MFSPCMRDTALPQLYAASVPVFLQALQRLRDWLALAEAHAARVGIAADAAMRARPAADMFPFGVQAQIVVNFTLRTGFPLAGQTRPDYGDFPDDPEGLRARIARAVALLHALDPHAFAGAEDRRVSDRAGEADVNLPGDAFLRDYALPNLYFHLAAAYIALRGVGVPLGKADFDGLHAYPPVPGRTAVAQGPTQGNQA